MIGEPGRDVEEDDLDIDRPLAVPQRLVDADSGVGRRAHMLEWRLACEAPLVPYRDAPPPVHAHALALTATARLVGLHGALQGLLRLTGAVVALLARAESNRLNMAAERGGPAPTSFIWTRLQREPFWALTPIVLAGLVLVAGVLVLLRMRGRDRVLGATAITLAVFAVAVAFMAAAPGTPAMNHRTVEALLALAQVPIVWAITRPGQRTFAWLTAACAAGLAYAVLGGLVRGHDMMSRVMRGDGGLLFGSVFVPAIHTLPFLCAGVAGWLPVREDLRGPPPEPALARAVYAVLTTALPVAVCACVGGLVAGLYAPLRDSWGAPFALGGLELIAPFAYGSLLVGGVATVAAARALSPRLLPIVAIATIASMVLGFPTAEPMRVGPVSLLTTPSVDGRHVAWIASASVLLLVAAWLAALATKRTEQGAALLAGDPLAAQVSAGARAITPRLVACATLAAVSLSGALDGGMLGRAAFTVSGLAGAASLVCAATLVRGFRARMAWLAELARRSASRG